MIFSLWFCNGCARTGNVQSKVAADIRQSLIASLERLPAVETTAQWDCEYAAGITVETAHYRIYSTWLDPLMMTSIPAYMEYAYQGYQSQLPKPVPSTGKMDIYIFATRGQWEQFTNTNTGELAPIYLKIKAGAYFLNGNCVAYNIGLTRTLSVLGHEGWHQFNARYFKYKLPSWLDEGIATLFEAGKFENGAWTFLPDRNVSRLGALKVTLVAQKQLPINELIALNPGQVLIESDQAVSGFYAQSYALVRYLREENYGQRLGNYQRMLLGALEGTWPMEAEACKVAADKDGPMSVTWNSYLATKAFGMYIAGNIAPMEKQYKLFCNKITYRMRIAPGR